MIPGSPLVKSYQNTAVAHWSMCCPGRFCTTAEASSGAGTVQFMESKICARGP